MAQPMGSATAKAAQGQAPDVRLEEELHQTRSQALDAARYHARELVRALRVAQGTEHGLDQLGASPPSGRVEEMIQEAALEQSQPIPAVIWHASDSVSAPV